MTRPIENDHSWRYREAAIIDITDYGVCPGDRRNAVPAAMAAVEACRAAGPGVVLRFPFGRYDFWPHPGHERDYYESNTDVANPRRLGILFEGLEGITLDGGGSTFVFHGRIQPITVDHCRDVTIRSLAIDWDVPMGAEAEVVAVSENALDLRLDPRAHPFEVEDSHIYLRGEGWRHGVRGVHPFTPDGMQCMPGGGDGWLRPGWWDRRAELLADDLVRVHGPVPAHLPVGTWFVLRCGVRDHAGIFLTESKDLAIHDVGMHHCVGLGILAQYCENLDIRSYRAEPAPGRRVLSAHDDGLQVSNCRGLVRVTDSAFRGLMDDPINVHGTSVSIIGRSADGRRLRCRFMHGQAIGLPWGHVGDRAAVIAPESLRHLAIGTVSDFMPHDEREFALVCDEGWPAEAAPGLALENLTWAPELEIRNCRFHGCRARGVLVTTPKRTVIANNRFASSGSAILISGDAHQWYESGPVRDVYIVDNTFEAACLQSMYQFCEGIISICPHITAPDPDAPAHRGIRIEGNTFAPTGQPLLYARSAEDLVFADNVIRPSGEFRPWHPRHEAVVLDACRSVRVGGNRVEAAGAAPALDALYCDELRELQNGRPC